MQSLGASANAYATAEANIAHDPEAAARVIEAFSKRGRLQPRLVPLDVTLRAPLTRDELDAVESGFPLYEKL